VVQPSALPCGGRLAAQADVAFIGIGTIGEHCALQEDGFLTEAEVMP
jgi:DNA-binding transcriptional regulator LsrR (DeoR family)